MAAGDDGVGRQGGGKQEGTGKERLHAQHDRAGTLDKVAGSNTQCRGVNSERRHEAKMPQRCAVKRVGGVVKFITIEL